MNFPDHLILRLWSCERAGQALHQLHTVRTFTMLHSTMISLDRHPTSALLSGFEVWGEGNLTFPNMLMSVNTSSANLILWLRSTIRKFAIVECMFCHYFFNFSKGMECTQYMNLHCDHSKRFIGYLINPTWRKTILVNQYPPICVFL